MQSNSLVVIATPQDFAEIQQLVEALDQSSMVTEETIITYARARSTLMCSKLHWSRSLVLTKSTSESSSSSSSSNNNCPHRVRQVAHQVLKTFNAALSFPITIWRWRP